MVPNIAPSVPAPASNPSPPPAIPWWGPSRLTRLCLANLLLLLALWLGAEYIAERTWPTTLLAYAPPLCYTPATALLLILALVRRNRVACILTLVSAALLIGPVLGLPPPHLAPNVTDSHLRLRVMTFNIAHGEGGANRIAIAVRAADSDVVCFQEISGYGKMPDPLPALRQALPAYTFTRAGEVAIASRLPSGTPQPCPLLTRAGVYRVALALPVTLPGGATATVVTAHLATTATGESLSLHRDGLPAYLRRTTEARAEQITRLNQFTRNLPGPVVLCGDFNTPPRGILFRRLSDGRTSAWDASGRGYGWTFSSKHPLLRIDHIFCAPGIVPVSCRIADVPQNTSDHYPLIAELAVVSAHP